jgi:GTP-binding protein
VAVDYRIEKIFCQSPQFLRGVTNLGELPEFNLPEIAFLGRSNVGKSSLINALFNRAGVARISNTPGRTQQLNFFGVQNVFVMVDLPGYGYARASKKAIEAWNNLLRLYLKGRPTLKRAYILIDSRHGIKKNDTEMMEMLDKAAVSYQLVLSKIDQVSDSFLTSMCYNIKKKIASHPAAYPHVLRTSSQNKEGIRELQESIYELVTGEQGANDE